MDDDDQKVQEVLGYNALHGDYKIYNKKTKKINKGK